MAELPCRGGAAASFAGGDVVRFHLGTTRPDRRPGRSRGQAVVRERASVPDEFAVFCREQHGRVVATIAVYCGDPALAEEVAQEALAKACQHWPRVGAPSTHAVGPRNRLGVSSAKAR